MNTRNLRSLAASSALLLLAAATMQTLASPAPAAGTTTTINVAKDKVKPTPTQDAAIQRAAAADIKDFIRPEEGGYDVAVADLNDDGRPDLLVQYSDISFCGSAGCSGVIVMATADGYSPEAIGLPNFYGKVEILPGKHQGMHDLRYDDSTHVWKWNGKEYD